MKKAVFAASAAACITFAACQDASAPSIRSRSLAAPSASFSVAPTLGLVGYWALDDETGTVALDNSGVGNNGTTHNATWIAGNTHGALSFNGTNAFVDVPYNGSSPLFTMSKFTVAFWANVTSMANAEQYLLGMQATGTASTFQIFAFTNNNLWAARVSTSPTTITSNQVVTPGVWTHVALTYDGHTATLYINGAKSGNTALGTAFISGPTALRIGDRSVNGVEQLFANAKFDEVRIYNRALDASEIPDVMHDVGLPASPGSPTIASFTAAPAIISPGAASTLSWATGAATTLSIDNGVGALDPLATSVAVSPTTTTTYTLTATNNNGSATAQTTVTVDAIPPVRSAGLPSGVLAAGTTSVILSLITNENAVCRYGAAAGVPYALLQGQFATTGGTSHSQPIAGLTNGTSYTYYVKCIDAFNNANADDYVISFSVSLPGADVSLVGYWAFDDATGTVASDHSGDGNGGTTHNTAWMAGKTNSGLAFNGTTAYVSVPNNPSNPLFTMTKFTVAFWANVASLAPGQQSFITTDNGGTNSTFQIFTLKTTNVWMAHLSTSASTIMSSQVITPGVWTHVALTYDGHTAILYINGVPSGNTILGTAFIHGTNPLRIGDRFESGIEQQFMNGALDEVRIYNRVLSAAEIPGVMNNAGLPVGPIPPRIYALTASPTSIGPGGSSTLSWSIGGATSVSIDQGVGALDPATTSVVVSPTTATTYTLTATNANGPSTAQTTVTVDNVAPTVSITTPASGATLAGTVTVAATALDNIGVAGVQFKLDGANVGAELHAAPYSIVVNSTALSNGPHTVSAVARDAAGNSATASIPVSVYNHVVTNVQYCSTDAALKMDVYYPPLGTATPMPATVYVHGGKWQSGDKSAVLPQELAELNHRGYVVFAVNYRMAPAHIFPAFVEDVKCSVRSVRANAAFYRIDPNHIGAWGESAGGHLVAMLGVLDNGTYEGGGGWAGVSSRVQAVVDYFGPADFTIQEEWYDVFLPTSDDPNAPSALAVQTAFGALPGSGDPVLAAASPVTYVSADDPPFMIFHGTADTKIDQRQSQHLYDALTAKGVSAQLIHVVGGGHGFYTAGISPSEAQITQMMANFFDSKLKTP